jgi:hypothetical protein
VWGGGLLVLPAGSACERSGSPSLETGPHAGAIGPASAAAPSARPADGSAAPAAPDAASSAGQLLPECADGVVRRRLVEKGDEHLEVEVRQGLAARDRLVALATEDVRLQVASRASKGARAASADVTEMVLGARAVERGSVVLFDHFQGAPPLGVGRPRAKSVDRVLSD